jgi:hypothetical protein
MPARKTRRRKTRGRREALVHAHLRNVSGKLLDEHWDVVREFVGRNPGIYALYKRNRLYYVGLTTGLASRLKANTRDRHRSKWDRFSIYLIVNDRHLKEIESLVLQIADPKGNSVGGKFAGSRDLRHEIGIAIRQKHKQAMFALFGPRSPKSRSTAVSKNRETTRLTKLLPNGARLKATLKGKSFRARARKDGQIRFDGRIFPSLSAAASVARKKPTNGWWFGRVERSRGNWVRLTQIRRAGTPIRSR